MDENQRENLSIEEDDAQDIEDEESCLETDNFMTDTSLYPKLSVECLKRQPIRQRKKNIPAELKDHISNPNNKETEAHSIPNDSYMSPIFFICIVAVFVILCCVCFYFYWSKPPPPLQSKRLNVQSLMNDLKNRFDGQPPLTYKVIESAIKRASSEKNDSPGIIVLISSKKTEGTTNELADRLAKLVSDPLNSVLIDSRYFSSAEQLKKEIDVTIRGNLTETQMRAVLVRNLDHLPFEAAMIFHGFCDHENAPFKRAVYVMTTFVEEAIPSNSDDKLWDMLASKHLKAVWRDSGEDQVSSLVNRLTVSVAAIVANGGK